MDTNMVGYGCSGGADGVGVDVNMVGTGMLCGNGWSRPKKLDPKKHTLKKHRTTAAIHEYPDRDQLFSHESTKNVRITVNQRPSGLKLKVFALATRRR